MSDEKHLLLFPFPAWGHIRPICAFAAKLVRVRAIRITLLTSCLYFDKTERELARYFDAGTDGALSGLISAIAIDEKESWMYTAALDAFNLVYDRLVTAEPLTCTQTGKVHRVATSPDLIIFDPLQYEALQYVRSHTVKPVKVIAWAPGNAAAFHYSYTRLGDFDAKITEEVTRSAKTPDEVATELFRYVDGRVVDRPGMQPFYDYECWPQELLFPEPALVQRHTFRFLQECDGVLLATPDAFQHDAIAAWAACFAETRRPVFAFGPLLPLSMTAAEAPEDPVVPFLDAALARGGKHSLIFISFGSAFWPGKSEYVWALLDTLIELAIPFIMAHASPFGQIPADVAARVTTSGLGLLRPWVQQETILAHAATGWFVSHCGQNSTLESLAHGVPMISWPIYADQPMNAAQVCALGAGYELVHVRTGAYGLRPLLRGKTPAGTLSAARDEFYAVLTGAQGEEGARMRAAAEGLAAAFARAWEDGGVCLAEMERFVEMIDALPII